MPLEDIREEAAKCQKCELCKGRIKPVFSKGNPNARIMICGMVPAMEENIQGLPFVGRAGKLLDNIMLDAGLSIDNIYITNLVKCFLAAGLPLQQSWIDACLQYIVNQIDIIKPDVIITLGKDAAITLLNIEFQVSMKDLRGKILNYDSCIRIIPTYHPSYLLRGGGTIHNSYKDVVLDFVKSKSLCDG